MRIHTIATLAALAGLQTASHAQVPNEPPLVIAPDSFNTTFGNFSATRAFGTSIAMNGDLVAGSMPYGNEFNLLTLRNYTNYGTETISAATGDVIRGRVFGQLIMQDNGSDPTITLSPVPGGVAASNRQASVLVLTEGSGGISTAMPAPRVGISDDDRVYVSSDKYEPIPGTVLGTCSEFSSSGGFSLTRTFENPRTASDGFGRSCAAAGAYVYVSAPLFQGTGPGLGTVYVYERSTGILLNRLDDPGAAPHGYGGILVPLQDNRLLVGPDYENTPTGDGDLWIWDLAKKDVVAHVSNPLPGPNQFGTSIAAGIGYFIVGMPDNSEVTLNGGAVYFFNTNDFLGVGKLASPAGEANDAFGNSVAIANGRIGVGAPGVSIGRIYVYDRPTELVDGWTVK